MLPLAWATLELRERDKTVSNSKNRFGQRFRKQTPEEMPSRVQVVENGERRRTEPGRTRQVWGTRKRSRVDTNSSQAAVSRRLAPILN